MVDPVDIDEIDLAPLETSTVVVGHGSSKDEGQQLARFISQRRYNVETFEASADDADTKIKHWLRHSASDPKIFFLLVSQADIEAGDRSWVRSGVFAQARALLGAFGKGRVILVVESGILDFDYKSGLDDVLYGSGGLADTYKSIAAFLLREFPKEGNAGPGRGPSRPRQRKTREPLETDVKIAVALLSLAALFGAIYIFRSFSGGSVVETTPNIAGVELTVPEPETNSQLASPEIETLQPPAATTSPSTSVRQSPALLARCQISLSRGAVTPALIDCDGDGLLRVTGHGGPWHNGIARVGLESQVSGSLTYEQDNEIVSLSPGVTKLDEVKSRFGVESLTLVFNADGKKVQFEEFGSLGSRVVTFTFDASG